MNKKIKESVVDCYINEYYKKKISIYEEKQPNFWKAVKQLCLDYNSDVSNLIMKNEKSDFCLLRGDYIRHISELYKEIASDTFTTLDAVKLIAQEIIKYESGEDANLRLFLLEKRFESLQEQISSRYMVFR